MSTFKVLVTTVARPSHPSHGGVAVSTLLVEFATYAEAHHAESTINGTSYTRSLGATYQSALLITAQPPA